MKYSPLISIIIPTFNSSQYLNRCIESIQNQSVKDYEIIFVDDLSTDNTLELLEDYQKKVPNIKIMKLKSKGMAGGARNLGISITKGKYISFVDSDDWLDTNFYFHHLNSLEKDNIDISVCGVKREYDNSKNSTVRYRYNNSNVINGMFALSLLTRILDQDIAISSIVCNKVFKKELLINKRLIFHENCLNEDDIFTFNAFLEAEYVAIISESNYHLYQRKGSASRNFSKKHIDDLFYAFYKIKQLLVKRNSFGIMRHHYYSFFEKCFSFVIESMRNNVYNEEEIVSYLKYAFEISKKTLSMGEFIEYCGYRRVIGFFES